MHKSVTVSNCDAQEQFSDQPLTGVWTKLRRGLDDEKYSSDTYSHKVTDTTHTNSANLEQDKRPETMDAHRKDQGGEKENKKKPQGSREKIPQSMQKGHVFGLGGR